MPMPASVRPRCSGCRVDVHGDPHQLGAGLRQRQRLGRRRVDVRGVRARHRLDDHRRPAADDHAADVDRVGRAAMRSRRSDRLDGPQVTARASITAHVHAPAARPERAATAPCNWPGDDRGAFEPGLRATRVRPSPPYAGVLRRPRPLARRPAGARRSVGRRSDAGARSTDAPGAASPPQVDDGGDGSRGRPPDRDHRPAGASRPARGRSRPRRGPRRRGRRLGLSPLPGSSHLRPAPVRGRGDRPGTAAGRPPHPAERRLREPRSRGGRNRHRRPSADRAGHLRRVVADLDPGPDGRDRPPALSQPGRTCRPRRLVPERNGGRGRFRTRGAVDADRRRGPPGAAPDRRRAPDQPVHPAGREPRPPRGRTDHLVVPAPTQPARRAAAPRKRTPQPPGPGPFARLAAPHPADALERPAAGGDADLERLRPRRSADGRAAADRSAGCARPVPPRPDGPGGRVPPLRSVDRNSRGTTEPPLPPLPAAPRPLGVPALRPALRNSLRQSPWTRT